MKKLLIFITMCYFMIPACSREKDMEIKINDLSKKVEELTKVKENDTFRKKIECKQYEAALQKDLSMDAIQMDLLVGVFYSSKHNSCLKAVRSIYPKDNGEILYIEDILTHEQIWFQSLETIQKAGVSEGKLTIQMKLLE